jgi:hypothetical protein
MLVTMRLIEIDLRDLQLPALMETHNARALAAAHVYERFVPYADDGWEWVTMPGSREFDGWTYADTGDTYTLASARLLCRQVAAPEDSTAARPTHGVSAYRTEQLTGRPWTATPASKRWAPLHSG